MAESTAGMNAGVGDGAVPINRPSEQDVVAGSAQELVEQAPEPTDDEGSKVYAVSYPTDQFVMEGMPVVTTTGTPLTSEQVDKLLPVAEASGVKIVEVAE